MLTSKNMSTLLTYCLHHTVRWKQVGANTKDSDTVLLCFSLDATPNPHPNPQCCDRWFPYVLNIGSTYIRSNFHLTQHMYGCMFLGKLLRPQPRSAQNMV